MRDYGRVFCAIWGSRDFRSLTEDGRALVLYLLTCPHTTMIGAFSLPVGYLVEDIQWTPERIESAFAELFRKGFATLCAKSGWVWIHKYLEWNEPDNPNQWKAARKLAAKIPSCSWLSEFHEFFERVAAAAQAENPKPSRNGSRTLSKPGTGTGEGSGTGVGTGSVTGTGAGTGGAHSSEGNGSTPGGEQRAGVDSGNGSSLEDPPKRRGDAAARRNGDFEAVNDAVSKLLASGVCTAEQPDLLAKLAHISPRQARESLRQLDDRGLLPTGAAA